MARYDVRDRTVLITGAARGIGAATARRLHERGANVSLVGLEEDRLESLVAELGDRAVCFGADVTDAAALERAVVGTVARFGGVDVAVANAGIHLEGALSSIPAQHFERVLEVNLLGVWRTNRAVLPHVVARRGYVLNIASLSAVIHIPLMGAYATSKAGVEAMTNVLRVELSPTGTRVGCAYFGFIDTDMVRDAFAVESAGLMRDAMPSFVGRPAPLDHAVDAIDRGIRRRASRLWAPRYVPAALLARGPLQPLSERRAMRSAGLAGAMRLAEERLTD